MRPAACPRGKASREVRISSNCFLILLRSCCTFSLQRGLTLSSFLEGSLPKEIVSKADCKPENE